MKKNNLPPLLVIVVRKTSYEYSESQGNHIERQNEIRLPVFVESVEETKDAGRGGVHFRSFLKGKKFFLPFERFSFV